MNLSRRGGLTGMVSRRASRRFHLSLKVQGRALEESESASDPAVDKALLTT